MIPAINRQSNPLYFSCNAACAKTTSVAIGMMMVIGAIATSLLHINTIASYSLAGIGGVLIVSSLLSCVFSQPTQLRKPHILIKESDKQIQRYKALPCKANNGKADRHSRTVGEPLKTCDQYRVTGWPTYDGRIYLDDGTPTNGAWVWERLILIQGPHNRTQFDQMERIAAEKNVGAVVRLGKIERYREYRLEQIPVLALEEWPDHDLYECEEVYKLILELEMLDGPIMIHCRGGFGRTGTFAACWKIYQEYKESWNLGQKTVEIDPAGIVKQMRLARTNMVEEVQFPMLLDFAQYLDALQV